METKKIEVDGKPIYLKKSGDRYRIVYPIKNEDGSMNWFNFWTGGSWSNVFFILAFVFLFLGLLHEYSSNINKLLDCFQDAIKLENCKMLYGSENLSLNLGGGIDEIQKSLSNINLSLYP